jgi:AraC-like DNA-binding protein
MLDWRTAATGAGLSICDVACSHARGRGETLEQAGGHALVLVRRGCFSRVADGVETVLDPTVAYCMNPGEEQRYDHPLDGGDDCTSLSLTPELVDELCGDDRLATGPLPVAPAADLEHRLLLSATRRGDGEEAIERALALASCALGHPGLPRPARPAHAALANSAREALAADPDASLGEVAAALAVSPHHLSRVFRAQTGATVARHRMRLRTRAALDRLGGGERDLGRLAADLGFADQSHLCRVVRGETGRTPGALRAALSPG